MTVFEFSIDVVELPRLIEVFLLPGICQKMQSLTGQTGSMSDTGMYDYGHMCRESQGIRAMISVIFCIIAQSIALVCYIGH